jgi:hypothetical protein
MITLLSILDKLLTLIQVWVVAKKEKDAQEQMDQVEANPADWFEHHFDSLHTSEPETVNSQADPQRNKE